MFAAREGQTHVSSQPETPSMNPMVFEEQFLINFLIEILAYSPVLRFHIVLESI